MWFEAGTLLKWHPYIPNISCHFHSLLVGENWSMLDARWIGVKLWFTVTEAVASIHFSAALIDTVSLQSLSHSSNDRPYFIIQEEQQCGSIPSSFSKQSLKTPRSLITLCFAIRSDFNINDQCVVALGLHINLQSIKSGTVFA